MKTLLFLPILTVFLSSSAAAQAKSNEAISRQIRTLKSEKVIELSYDQGSNVSKLRAVTENFPDAGKAGVLAMNFAAGFMYSGREITRAPENILFTFWVLTKKPRFAANHNFVLNDSTGGRDLGQARYVAKPREDMEYLNFELSRADLEKIASQPVAGFKLGESEFVFTKGQQKAISDLLTISDPAR